MCWLLAKLLGSALVALLLEFVRRRTTQSTILLLGIESFPSCLFRCGCDLLFGAALSLRVYKLNQVVSV